MPSIAVSNLIEIRGFAPDWDGDLLVGSLKGQSLRRLRLEGGRVQYDEPIFVGDRIRDIAQSDDDTILVWTDSAKLIKLSIDRDMSPAEQLMRELPPAVTGALADCRQCHSFDDGQSPGKAVSLWGVFGRRIAAGDAQLYSAALKETSGPWDEAALDRFLSSPQTMVPGTTMQYGGIADPEVRGHVIDFLKRLK